MKQMAVEAFFDDDRRFGAEQRQLGEPLERPRLAQGVLAARKVDRRPVFGSRL